MSFITSLIAKSQDTVLAEYTEYDGNFQQVSRLVLQNIQENSKGIIKSGIRKFHYINEKGITFLCLTEEISNEVAFAFLYDVQCVLFEETSANDVLKLTAYGLKSFEPKLAELMDHFKIQPIMTRHSSKLVDEFKNVNCEQESLSKFIGKEITLTIKTKESSDYNFQNNIKNMVSC